MFNRVLIRQEDLCDMIHTLGNTEISGILNPADRFAYDHNTDRVRASHTSANYKQYEERIESLLLAVLIIKKSTHRLILEMGEGFLYEYRKIYFACDGIVITDKKADSEYVRFTLASYLPPVIGALSCVGEPSMPGTVPCSEINSGEPHPVTPKIRVKEVTPDGEREYETRCDPGEEPEEMERMVKFTVFSHRASHHWET